MIHFNLVDVPINLGPERGEQRKTNKEIAAERREKFSEGFKSYQDRANIALHEKKSSCKF